MVFPHGFQVPWDIPDNFPAFATHAITAESSGKRHAGAGHIQ
jgi:hypothetical protein